MSEQEKSRPQAAGTRSMDRKTAFDAGYNAYEDGNRECEFGPGAKIPAIDDTLAVMWRAGWQRAQEDSALPGRYFQKRPAGGWASIS